MLHHLITVSGLALLCAAWLWVQRLVQRLDPDNPGLDRKCGTCRCPDRERARCDGNRGL